MRKRPRPNSTEKKDRHAILVRLPVDQHSALKRKAEEERRSVNAEVLTAIDKHLEAAA